MDTLFEKFDKIYYNKIFKVLYTSLGYGITFVLFLVIPIFRPREIVISSIWIDLIIRVGISMTFGRMFYYASHLDEVHQNFYKGADTHLFAKPDELKQGVNILAGFAFGTLIFFNYRACLLIFLPDLGIGSTIISIVLGLLFSIPLISQYKKR